MDFRSLILEKSQFLLTNYKDEVKNSIVQKLELSRNNIVNDLPTSLKQIKKTKSHRKRVICKKPNLMIRIKSKQCKKSQKKKLPTKTIYRLRRVNLKVNREDNMETATVSNLIPDGISLQSKRTNNNSTLKVDKESISNASNTQFDSLSSNESSDEEENSELDGSGSDEDSDSSDDDFVVFSKQNDDGNNDKKNISINSTDSDDNFIIFNHVNDDYDQKDDDDDDDDEDEDEDDDDEDDDEDDDDNDNDNEINDSINSKDSVDGFIVLQNNDDNQTACCQSSGANDVQKNEKKSKKEKRKAKVSFDLKPQVHLMIKWDFAYRKARPGPWEQAARDRGRFARRVSDSHKVLDKILLPAHRARIFEERFQDTS
ncbi:dentin sialophosphoprotein-like isoform X2 [Trichogramma pretiosum]|nr:dentin sialophosphoprotein-like isoform X2 [Trichogramma pretiosum]